MAVNKTDIEIAADAIRYCRAKLNTYETLLLKAKLGDLNKPVSDGMIEQWRYEAQRLEFILGESEEMPKPYWRR